MEFLVKVIILLSMTPMTPSSGVTKWCYYKGKKLKNSSSDSHVYSTLSEAKSECLKRADCFGVTKQGKSGLFQLRKNWRLESSSSGGNSYVPCKGYFNCNIFGLISVHGKYLSAQKNGKIMWNSEEYGSLEHVTFEQYGEETVHLKSAYGKYLAATDKNKLEWNRSKALSWEQFQLFQYEDKIALKSYHGRYLSAEEDGTVRVDRKSRTSSEWFMVDPPECLANTQCECGDEISPDDYEMVGVDYDLESGKVESYPPEQVGYQHIDNSASSSDQSTKFSVSEAVTETSSFTHSTGASVTVGTSFKTGVPFVSQGEISTSVSASYDYSWGEETSVTKTMQADYNCIAAAGKVVSCRALLFKYYMTVPYTQHWKHKRLSCECDSEGVFTDVSASEMRLVIDEE